ncbi:MAG: PD-(D/E)XK nuclease family protein [Bacteroidales bacterium]|nr:PD-(D/E)XK nuclease family protein [Bacteroidales bacterium]
MTPFLQQAASYWAGQEGLPERVFVFPGKRAITFFRKHLTQIWKEKGGTKPLLMPLMLTVNDFFYKVGGACPSERTDLLLTLYDCYKSLNDKAEPLDEFIFWGDVLLGDFSDVDKYMVDARALFVNVENYKDMKDSWTYLSDDQKKAIESFVSHFSATAARGEVKDNFLHIWKLLSPLYETFRAELSRRHLAYDGMVYRNMAGRLKEESAADILASVFGPSSRFVFVGLNALSTSELFVLRKMRDAGLADFCWDYSSEMIRDPRNRSSFFMSENISALGRCDVTRGETLPQTRFKVLSVPSSTGQASFIPQILKGLEGSTAIVLPDESLLVSVLNSIPEDIKDINVTMGYPLKGSAIASLLSQAASLQLRLRKRDDGYWFYHLPAGAILTDNLFRMCLDERELEEVSKIKSEARYYIPESRFGFSDLMKAVFRPVVTDPKATDPAQVKALGAYLSDLLVRVVSSPSVKEKMPQELEFARRYLRCLSLLQSRNLPVMPKTYLRLLEALVGGETVPYTGEPVKGLQIMGPLEMRALDFDNIIILSCNEGTFPRRSVSSSFIPPELRKGFEMPTYEFQDAIWAYYFYRMVQRAGTVWMLYESRTEKMKSGEESRYVKQLRYHFGVDLERYVAGADIASPVEDEVIPKPSDMQEKLRKVTLSASALQDWLKCPAMFWYGRMEGLKPEQEVAESLDSGMLGNVYHKTMQALYSGEEAMQPGFPMDAARAMTYVTKDYIKGWLSRKDALKARIRSLIAIEMKSPEVSGRNLVFEQLVLKYALKTLERDLGLMEQHHTDRFRIFGLELKKEWRFEGYKFLGFIDRMDSFGDGITRIVDYKTGKVSDEDVNVTDENAGEVMEKLFGTDEKKRPKIALQLFLYDMYVTGGDPDALSKVENVIYPAAKLFVSDPPSCGVSMEFIDGMKDRLHDLLGEIADPSRPIIRTSDRDTCKWCDFKNICGR